MRLLRLLVLVMLLGLSRKINGEERIGLLVLLRMLVVLLRVLLMMLLRLLKGVEGVVLLGGMLLLLLRLLVKERVLLGLLKEEGIGLLGLLDGWWGELGWDVKVEEGGEFVGVDQIGGLCLGRNIILLFWLLWLWLMLGLIGKGLLML